MPDVHSDSTNRIETGGFWAQRLSEIGHTGWSDSVCFAYDQHERLAIIRSLVMKIGRTGGNALDFGCGTGDFSKLLLEAGFNVCGLDPYVPRHVKSSRYAHAMRLSEIPFEDGSVDFILSVTVLDHILDDGRLHEVLDLFRRLLRSNGVICMLEYALDTESDRERLGLRNEYQAFRTLGQWRAALEQHDIHIVEVTPTWHPVFNCSVGYRAFKERVFVRLLARMERLFPQRSILDVLLSRSGRRFVQAHLAEVTGPKRVSGSSPLKVILCTSP